MKNQIRIYAIIFCVLFTAQSFCQSPDPGINDQVGYSGLFEVIEKIPARSGSTGDLIPPTFEITHTENGDVTIYVTSDEDLYSGWVGEKLIWSVANFDNWSLNTRLKKDPQNNIYTGVGINDFQSSIFDFQLSNYPNPFNHTTTISFSLPENTKDAEILIYNLKSQKIKQYSIFNNQSLIIWDGTDENNQPVSSGIYFYKLKAGNDFSETKRMLLIN